MDNASSMVPYVQYLNDKDESYLLQSYNQNQQLFANLHTQLGRPDQVGRVHRVEKGFKGDNTVKAKARWNSVEGLNKKITDAKAESNQSSSRASKTGIFSRIHTNQTPEQHFNIWKSTDASQQSSKYFGQSSSLLLNSLQTFRVSQRNSKSRRQPDNENSDERLFLFDDVKILSQICQDQGENQFTAGKNYNRYQQQMLVEQLQQPIEKTNIIFNNKQKLQKSQKYQEKCLASFSTNYLKQQVEWLDYENIMGEMERKFNSLVEFVTEICTKYKILTQTILSYQQIIQQQTNLIEDMRILIDTYHKDTIYEVKRVECMSYDLGDGRSFGSSGGNIGECMEKVEREIVGRIRRVWGIGGEFVSRSMSCTRSVPVICQNMVRSCNQYRPNEGIKLMENNYSPEEMVLTSNSFKKQPSQPHITTKQISQFNPQNKIALPLPEPHNPQPPLTSPSPGQSNYQHKLSTLRIKQLQSQNSSLQNQLRSYSKKVMVLRNENKQLKDIVEGLLVQIRVLVKQQPNNYQHLRL